MASGIQRSISVVFASFRPIRIALTCTICAMGIWLIAVVFGGPPRFPYVGVWMGERHVDLVPGADPAIGVSVGKVEVHIKPTGRFDLTDGGLDYSGTVAYDGGDAVLSPETVEGTPVERQPDSLKRRIPVVRLKPGPGGTLTETESITSSEPVVLRRQQS